MRATILENPWIPIEPTPRQAEFLLNPEREVLYGGAAGGGKSEGLLAAAAQYVDVPSYAALLLRRTYADLSLPGALMDRADSWWAGTAAEWKEAKKTWQFPSGATITFGYLETERDKFRYASSEFQFVGFDELTQFTRTQFLFLNSRLRRLEGSKIPIRLRAGSNPGGIGHEWVGERFIFGDKTFIPAKVSDNPHLDQAEYVKSLMELDPVTRRQLLDGDWGARLIGGMFKRESMAIVDDYPREIDLVRYWDLAATEVSANNADPDWTVGLLLGRSPDGVYWVIDVKRMRGTPREVEALIAHTASEDGPGVKIRMEQEGGASGKSMIDYYRRDTLSRYDFKGNRPSGNKRVRAGPISSQAEAGNLKIVRGRWNRAFLDELELFDQGLHDDQVDALSGAHAELSDNISRTGIRVRSLGRK